MVNFSVIFCSNSVKKWEVECIESILRSNYANCSLIISIDTLQQDRFSDEKKKARFIKFLNSKISKPESVTAVALNNRFSQIPFLNCTVKPTKRGSIEFDLNDIESIKAYELDFIIMFTGIDKLVGEVLKCSKYGMWTYLYGDHGCFRSDLACFWAILKNEKMVRVNLARMDADTGKYCDLKQGYIRIFKNSYRRSVNNIQNKSTNWIEIVCRQLTSGQKLNSCEDYIRTKKNNILFPSIIEFLFFSLKMVLNKFCFLMRHLFFIEQWNIGFIKSSISDLVNTKNKYKIHWIFKSSRRVFYADPFIISHNNKLFIFFERYNYKNRKGSICCAELKDNNEHSEIYECFNGNSHLAYPYVFRDCDKIYIIIYESEYKEIVLYEASNFPVEWEKRSVLLQNIETADPTIFKYNNLWWLICTYRYLNDNIGINIYYAHELRGPWIAHALNPVKIDARSSRPAGPVIEINGDVIRPAQNCSNSYGEAVVLNKILDLSPTKFKEQSIFEIVSGSHSIFLKGVHTLAEMNDNIYLDAKRYILSLTNMKSFIDKITKRI